MGKSNKKVKNDRINAIRKQYDAFLEEDKKRRERNEYILVKLDKMRSTTALVPISNKARYHMELNPFENIMHPSNLRTKTEAQDSYVSHLEKQTVTSSVLSRPMDELHLLKEISKKYILIPKTVSPIENEYNYSKDLTAEDWKSKYNILDDLKKLEKEGRSEPISNQYNDSDMLNKRFDLSTDSNISHTQPPNPGCDPNIIDKPIRDNNDEFTVNKLHNSPIKLDEMKTKVNFDIDHDNLNCEPPVKIASMPSHKDIKTDQTQSTYNAMQETTNICKENITENEKYNSESNEKDSKLLKNDNRPKICEISNETQPTVYNENINPPGENIQTADPNIYVSPENNQLNMSNIMISDQIISHDKQKQSDTVEYSMENTNFDRDIDKQQATNEVQDVTYTERVEVNDDIDNNPVHQIVAKETTLDKPQHDDPVQNIIPADNENIQQSEQVEHASEINAFETEQNEMFYSEQADTGNYIYNQGEGHTGEYQDGYEQNEQYSYYEGVQHQEPYETNINEHEESTERYDPHYNQQYEGSYENQQPVHTVGYEATNAYEQQELDKENVANYENQQENVLISEDGQVYDQVLYAENPETQEHIEQQLTAEEGYFQSSPVTADEYQPQNEGEVENVINIAPEELMPEPKLA